MIERFGPEAATAMARKVGEDALAAAQQARENGKEEQ